MLVAEPSKLVCASRANGLPTNADTNGIVMTITSTVSINEAPTRAQKPTYSSSSAGTVAGASVSMLCSAFNPSQHQLKQPVFIDDRIRRPLCDVPEFGDATFLEPEDVHDGHVRL